MNYPLKYSLFLFMAMLLLFSSCSEEKRAAIPVVAPPPVANPVPQKVTAAPEEKTEVPPPKISGLAVLQKLVNRADMRPHDKSVWQTAVTGTDFFKHDALQTHEGAYAHVKYESGSLLELKEKTLVMFDKDPGLTERSSDRVVLKNGELVGTTKKELWVFTNAGLLQIKSNKKSPAQATLSINPERKLKITVYSGSAELIVKKNETEFQKFNLAEKSEFEFKAKADTDVIAIAKASIDIKKSTLAELYIDSPTENATVTDEKFDVKGRLTELGAKLLINGELTDIADDLSFKKTLALVSGTNLLVFQLIRSDASVKFYRRNIRLNTGK